MKKFKSLWIIYAATFLSGCSSPHILITSNKYRLPLVHSKIMVVGVIKDNNDSIRTRIEKNIAADLGKLGYNAASAIDAFGSNGFSNLGEQDTYLKLCNDGIDAVIIIALIDRTKESRFRNRKSYSYPDNYYYRRIWNYRSILADVSDNDTNIHGRYFWEAIFFNINTLEAECTIQSSLFTSVDSDKFNDFEKQIVRKLTREKILKKQNIVPPKPF